MAFEREKEWMRGEFPKTVFFTQPLSVWFFFKFWLVKAGEVVGQQS